MVNQVSCFGARPSTSASCCALGYQAQRSLACGLVGAGLVDSPSMGRRIQKASLNFPSTSRPGFNCAGYLVKPGLRFR